MGGGRNSGIDLLRSIAMFMVVVLHVLNYGVEYESLPPFSINWGIAWFLEGASIVAVNIYAAISGYVLVDKKWKISRIINLWQEVFFYSVLSILILLVFTPNSIGVEDIIKAFFPICSQQFWYFTAYFGMFWFIPILNWIINTLEFNKFQRLIWSLLIVFGFLPWISEVLGASSFGVQGGYTSLWLTILYMIGAGIKKYGFQIFSINKQDFSKKWFGGMALLCIVLIFLSKVALSTITMSIFGKEILTGHFYSYLSPLVVMESVYLLCFFSKLKIKNYKFWANLSKITFGVYLFHQTGAFYKFVWNYFAKYRDTSALLFVGVVLGGALLIFVVCSFIEKIRCKLFDIFKVREIANIIEKQIKKILLTR